MLLSISCALLALDAASAEGRRPRARGRVLFKEKASAMASPRGRHGMSHFIESHGMGTPRTIHESGVKVGSYRNANYDEEALAAEMVRSGLVEWAQPDYKHAPTATTNDPLLSQQWFHQRIGTLGAWDTTTGEPQIVVAVLDSGFQLDHPDLKDRYVLPGFNAVDGGTDVGPFGVGGDHGTMTAGCVAASGNNGIGVAGAAYGVRILPIRVTNSADSNAWTSDMVRGMQWAADNGAKVINLSYGGEEDPAVDSAAQYIRSKGGLHFMSAGNDGVNSGSPDRPSFVLVSATDSSDNFASWSTWGDAVDLSAPGESVLTTTTSSGYASVSGTSFSSPIAAGVGALVYSVNPAFSPEHVEQILFCTAQDLGQAGDDNRHGHGRVDAAAAVARAVQEAANPSTLPLCNLGGGPSPPSPSPPAPTPPVGSPPAPAPGDCVNDDSTTDPYGDTCSSWYDGNVGSASDYSCSGVFDDNDFTAAVQCCACGGGSTGGTPPVNPPAEPPVQPPTQPPIAPPIQPPVPPPTEPPAQPPTGPPADPPTDPVAPPPSAGCVNDDTSRDSYGDTCTDWYDNNVPSPDDQSCLGMYDDGDFTAATQCCACGGGSSSGPPLQPPVPPPTPCIPNPCLNGGACEPTTAGDFTCDCLDGWEGDLCGTPAPPPVAPPVDPPTPCSPNPCLNGGACEPGAPGTVTDDFVCSCPDGWEGELCGTPAPEPPPPGQPCGVQVQQLQSRLAENDEQVQALQGRLQEMEGRVIAALETQCSDASLLDQYNIGLSESVVYTAVVTVAGPCGDACLSALAGAAYSAVPGLHQCVQTGSCSIDAVPLADSASGSSKAARKQAQGELSITIVFGQGQNSVTPLHIQAMGFVTGQDFADSAALDDGVQLVDTCCQECAGCASAAFSAQAAGSNEASAEPSVPLTSVGGVNAPSGTTQTNVPPSSASGTSTDPEGITDSASASALAGTYGGSGAGQQGSFTTGLLIGIASASALWCCCIMVLAASGATCWSKKRAQGGDMQGKRSGSVYSNDPFQDFTNTDSSPNETYIVHPDAKSYANNDPSSPTPVHGTVLMSAEQCA